MRAIASQAYRIVLWTWQGCGHLEGYGYHPGTGFMAFLLALAMAAGAKGGAEGVLIGLAIMGVTFGPLYLFGAYDRARDFHQQNKED